MRTAFSAHPWALAAALASEFISIARLVLLTSPTAGNHGLAVGVVGAAWVQPVGGAPSMGCAQAVPTVPKATSTDRAV